MRKLITGKVLGVAVELAATAIFIGAVKLIESQVFTKKEKAKEEQAKEEKKEDENTKDDKEVKIDDSDIDVN